MTGVRSLAVALLALAGVLCVAPRSDAQLVDPGSYRRPERAAVPGDPGDDRTRVLRNQADMRAALEDLRTDVQVTQAKVDELTVQFAQILAEMQALRAALDGGRTRAKTPVDTEEPVAFPALARPATAHEPPARRPRRRRTTRRPEAPAAPVLTPKRSSRPPAPPVVAALPVETAAPAERPAPAVAPTPVVSPTAQVPVPPVAAPLAAGQDPFPAYEAALNDYHARNYALARDAFAEFLRLFPTSTYANNAQFYIGQCFYAENKYKEAVDAYQVVLDRYPSGSKVPSAMLKMGYAQQKLGKVREAKRLLQLVVDTYPFSSEAQLARARLKRM